MIYPNSTEKNNFTKSLIFWDIAYYFDPIIKPILWFKLNLIEYYIKNLIGFRSCFPVINAFLIKIFMTRGKSAGN